MSDDDLLRSLLEQEARLVPMRRDARDALNALEPAFRRATIKRTSLIAASTVLVLGGTVAAFNVVRPTDDEISVVSPVTAITEPLTTTVGIGPTRDGDGVPTSLDDDSTIHSPIEISGGDGPEHSVPSSAATTSVAAATTAPPTTGGSGGGDDGGDGGVDPTSPPPTPSPSVTTTAPPTTPAPSTTAPSGEQLTRYDSTCGSVLADLATSPPTIVEVVVASGYRYRLEDPDGDSITVQFTGPGEDCEVKVGTHDDADHAERSESEESSGDDSPDE